MSSRIPDTPDIGVLKLSGQGAGAKIDFAAPAPSQNAGETGILERL